MKNLFVLVLLAITLGCNCAPLKRGSQDDFRAMRDSMVNTFQQGMLQHDTSLVMQSWRMSENLLQVDKTHKENIYHHRAVVMAWLGRKKEAIENRWLEIQCMNDSNPDKLVYMAKKYTIENKKDSAHYYISKLLEFCDSNKDKHYNDQKSHEGYMAYLKLIAISLNEGPAKGKEFLDKQLKKDPDNDFYKYLKDNWKDFLKYLNDKT